MKKLIWDLAGGELSLYKLDEMDNHLSKNERIGMKARQRDIFDNVIFKDPYHRMIAEDAFIQGYLAAHSINHARELGLPNES